MPITSLLLLLPMLQLADGGATVTTTGFVSPPFHEVVRPSLSSLLSTAAAATKTTTSAWTPPEDPEHREDWLECRDENPEAVKTWDVLSSLRRRELVQRGWSEERWNREDKCNMPLRQSIPEAFHVHVVENVNVPLNLTSATLKEMSQTSIRLVSGDEEENEEFVDAKSLEEIITGIEDGDTSFYLHLEEAMHEKSNAELASIGQQVVDSLLPLARDSPALHRPGLWQPEWNAIGTEFDWDDSFDWALFAGAKGTASPLHYDDDLFNFLYLIEGRKRIIIIPNDNRTEGSFPVHQNSDGQTAYGELDVFAANVTLPEHTIDMVLEAGQAIALPYVSWHAVENLENTLAVSLRLVDW